MPIVASPRNRRLAISMVVAIAMTAAVASFATSASAQRQDGELRVVLASQPNIDPIFASRAGQWMWSTILDVLIKPDQRGRLTKAGIITDWKRTDARTWRFTVRPNVTFTNGEKGDAFAVANSILLNKFTTGAILSTYFQNLAYARAINPTTVVVRTKLPQYNLANLLGTVYLLPPKYYKQVGTAGFNAAPVGTGPFKLDAREAGRSFKVLPNTGHWGDKPKVPGIIFTYAPDPSQRLALVQSGAADVAADLPPAQADLARNAKLKVQSVSSTSKPMLFMQTTRSPLDDVAIRKAVAYAIDRNAISQGIFKGRFKADAGMLNIIPGSKPKETLDYNPTEAKKILNGRSFTLTLNYNTDRSPGGAEVAQAIAGMLEAVGFKVTLEPNTYVQSVVKILGGQMTGLYITPAVPNVPDPDFFVQGFMTKGSITKNCVNEQFDKLAADALQKNSIEEAQPIYDQLNSLGVVKLACYVPLYFEEKVLAMRNNVSGVVFTPINVIYWDKVTV